MTFPHFISFTVTNACNLRCRMCGQWGDSGYLTKKVKSAQSRMKLNDWKRLVDEISGYDIRFVLVRGGEPFLFPGIIELLKYISGKGIFVSVDSNGTLIGKYARDLVDIRNMHITFSVDGPEEIHDEVRRQKGSYKKIKENIALLTELEKDRGNKISKSICFTISRYSYKGLGAMPDVAREMGLNSINIVPYYYFSEEIGEKYNEELKTNFDCEAYSWKGFHYNGSGIDFNLFKNELQKYNDSLGEVSNFPYMPLIEEDYRLWFDNSYTPVGSQTCRNVEDLIDIQPDGQANFCVDFPDYSIGDAMHSSIKEIWNSPRAEKFRQYRRKKPLTVCYRCGAKYIAEIKE
ncbi:MAG: radical SAM protein [Calditrichaceae bacterium]|nr:radical SAM protein [Calditrichaceae bacterium]MBN2710148.1 radical SAM protein [Calditrichaceae bacterium]RQV95801.1 MAG: radical SAM protein [Calditrichota bacterium]